MITAYLDATSTQEGVAKEYGYNRSRLTQIIGDMMLIFADIAKTNAPYRITITEDGKEIEKQFGTIDG